MYIQPEKEHSYSREDLRRELIEKSLAAEQRKQATRKKSKTNKVILVLVFFVVIALCVLAFLLIDRFNGNSTKDGEISFDESVTAEERSYILDRFTRWKSYSESARLTSDAKVSAETVYSLEEGFDNHDSTTMKYTYDIFLPTVDFYDSELNVTKEEAEKENSKVKWVSLTEIKPENRVVSLDNHYFFDEYYKGAKYRVMTIESGDKFTTQIIAGIFSTKFTADDLETGGQNDVAPSFGSYSPFGKDAYLSFAQTGVTALVRAMTITLNEQANGRGSWFADNIKDFLKSKDLTHISNEASFIDGCKGSTGTMMLCSDWRSLDSITAIGTDIVELTGNHNNNYGTDANIKTINKYHELGMKTFGGGINETEAAKPLELNEKDIKITMLGYNKSSSTRGNGELTDGDKPGANEYTEEKAAADIKAAKTRGDFVIVDLQFAECYAYPDGYTEMPECDAPISGQKDFFRHLVDLGADLVIGTQAHHPQTYEIYKGVPIYYGLGNFFFDQTYWPGTQRGYILTHYFDVYSGKYLNTRISPTWYDKKHQVYLTDETTSEYFIKRLMNSSPKGN
ncbi:CapA family protein [Candidatus Saccharibacteria bacterium]|nr:CapA family protein [Candidatus Saccharibacteria bacterium]